MAGYKDGKLGNNLRQAYDENHTKDLDPKFPSIQDDGQDEKIVDEQGESRVLPQVLAALSVSMGSLAVGYASVYTSPAGLTLNENSTDITVSTSEMSWIGGLLPLAALVGGVVGGSLIDIFGRKTTILGTAIPFIVSWLFIGLATNVPLILTGRAIAGFCIGLASLALPVYLGETVQPEVRGTLGLLPTVFGNSGILLCYSVGMFLNWWQLALLGTLIPVPYLILICIIPETPSWYLAKGKEHEAMTALQWLRGKTSDISREYKSLKENADKNKKSSSSLRSIFVRANLQPLGIIIGLMFFQQFSGVNAVFFYAGRIFKDVGTSLDENICSIILGCVNFGSTFLATGLIDRMGRKMLLYISTVTMTVTLASLGGFMYLQELDDPTIDLEPYNFVPLLSLVFYVIGFSLGFGPIPWLMMGEILPAKIRGPAASLATAFNWACTSIVTLTFANLREQLGDGHTFWMFGCICFLAFFFIIFCVPETSGKSLEDIEKRFAKQTRRMSSIANLRPSPMSV